MAKKKAPPILCYWQGAQVLRDDSYFLYNEETKNAAQPKNYN